MSKNKEPTIYRGTSLRKTQSAEYRDYGFLIPSFFILSLNVLGLMSKI